MVLLRSPGLRRMLLHSLVVAILLALLGFLLAQLALWGLSQTMIVAPPTPPDAVEQTGASAAEHLSAMQWQLPWRLAGLGVLLVVLGEGGLLLIRRMTRPGSAHQQQNR
jgi:ABC-type antimicrobial peptide transport system permease subunit